MWHREIPISGPVWGIDNYKTETKNWAKFHFISGLSTDSMSDAGRVTIFVDRVFPQLREDFLLHHKKTIN